MKKVFLGGTCNNSIWRDDLIPLLKIDYFNPVVDDWTHECQAEELNQRANCDYCLYVITPNMTGVYSIAKVVDDSNKKPEKTIFCFLEFGVAKGDVPENDYGIYFDDGQIKSLTAVGEMIQRNRGKFFKSLTEIANFLNQE